MRREGRVCQVARHRDAMCYRTQPRSSLQVAVSVPSDPSPQLPDDAGTQARLAHWVERLASRQGGLLLGLVALAWSCRWLADPDAVIVRRDAMRMTVPFRDFLGVELRAGRIPTWFPGDGLGIPLWGSSVAGLASPLNWLSVLFDGLSLSRLQAVAAIAIAGWGASRYARSLGAERTGGWLAALAYAGSGHLAGVLDNAPYLHSAACLPWAMWRLERLVERPTGARMVAFAVAFLGVATGGDLQSALLLALLSGTRILISGPESRRRGIPVLIGAGVLVLAWLAPTLPATLGVAADSGRLGGLPREEAVKWSMLPARLLELVVGPLVAPAEVDALGARIAPLLGGADAGLWVVSEWFGTLPLMAALFAFARGRSRWPIRFAGIVAALALLASLGAHGPLSPLWDLAVLRTFRYPEKYLVFALAPLSALAGVGLGILSRGDPRGSRAVSAGAALLLLLAVATPGLGEQAIERGLPAGLGQEVVRGLASAFVVRVVVAAGCLLLLAALMGRVRPAFAAVLVVGMAALQGSWAMAGLPFVGSRTAFETPSRFAAELTSLAGKGEFRLASAPPGYQYPPGHRAAMGAVEQGNREAMVGNLNARYGLGNIYGYAPGYLQSWVDACGRTTRPGSPCARRLGGRFPIVPTAYAPTLAAVPGLKELARIDEPMLVAFEDTQARPLASSVRIERLREAAEIRKAFRLDAEPSTAFVLEGEPVARAAGRVEASRPRPDRVAVVAELEAAGAVLVAEQCSSGWSAELDGRAVALERADLGMCLIRMEGGRHELLLSYLPPGWPWLWLGPLLAVLSSLGLILRERGRST